MQTRKGTREVVPAGCFASHVRSWMLGLMRPQDNQITATYCHLRPRSGAWKCNLRIMPFIRGMHTAEIHKMQHKTSVMARCGLCQRAFFVIMSEFHKYINCINSRANLLAHKYAQTRTSVRSHFSSLVERCKIPLPSLTAASRSRFHIHTVICFPAGTHLFVELFKKP